MLGRLGILIMGREAMTEYHFNFIVDDEADFALDDSRDQMAKSMCENFLNECTPRNIEDAKLAASQLLIAAECLFDALHNGTVTEKDMH